MIHNLASLLKNDKVKNGLRIGLGIVIFAFVLTRIPLDDLTNTLKNVVWQYIAAAFFLNIITGLVLAYRCYVLFGAYPDAKPAFIEIIKISFSGMFFNQVLPSSVGGDIYRVAAIARLEGGTAGAFSIVFLDRMTGLLGLFLTGLLALVFGARSMGLPLEVSLWSAAALLLLTIFLELITHPKTQQYFIKLTSYLPKSPWISGITSRINKLFAHFTLYNKQHGILLATVALSILARFIWVFGAFLIGLGMHLSIAYPIYLAGLSVVELIRSIPITIQGLGIREGAFSLIFTRFGLSPVQAITLATIFYALCSLNNILGGVLFLLPTHIRKKA